jgi:hypothetical protein
MLKSRFSLVFAWFSMPYSKGLVKYLDRENL